MNLQTDKELEGQDGDQISYLSHKGNCVAVICKIRRNISLSDRRYLELKYGISYCES